MKFHVFLLSTLFATIFPVAATAQINPDIYYEGLDNPCGIAIQPETGFLFVSESGAGKIIKIIDRQPFDIVVGFPVGSYGEDPQFKIGPLGLAFIDKNTMVVGCGSDPDGADVLRVYKIPRAQQTAINYDDHINELKLEPLDGKNEGMFYGLSVARARDTKKATAIFATCQGDDSKGYVAKADVDTNGQVSNFRRYIETMKPRQDDQLAPAPTAITINQKGEVLVCQMGGHDDADSTIALYRNDAGNGFADGERLANFPTGLNDITGIAYSPMSRQGRTEGQLYVTDFRWPGTELGGLYHIFSVALSEGKQGVQANLVIELDKPTAMAFHQSGALYITVLGTPVEGSSQPAGKLIRIPKNL